MLLGDLIARFDDEGVAMEALIALDDLALARRASDAAGEEALDVGAFMAVAVRRYLNQAPPDEWATLMSAMDRSGDPASVLIRRALVFVLNREECEVHDNAERA